MHEWIAMATPGVDTDTDTDEESWTVLSDAIVAFGAAGDVGEEDEEEEEEEEDCGVLVPMPTPRCIVADCTGVWAGSFYDCGYFGTHPDFAFVSEHDQERCALQRIHALCSRAGTVRAMASKGVTAVLRVGFDPKTYVNALLRFEISALGMVVADATALVTK